MPNKARIPKQLDTSNSVIVLLAEGLCNEVSCPDICDTCILGRVNTKEFIKFMKETMENY